MVLSHVSHCFSNAVPFFKFTLCTFLKWNFPTHYTLSSCIDWTWAVVFLPGAHWLKDHLWPSFCLFLLLARQGVHRVKSKPVPWPLLDLAQSVWTPEFPNNGPKPASWTITNCFSEHIYSISGHINSILNSIFNKKNWRQVNNLLKV